MNPLDPHNQLEEHLRDSAPDNSRRIELDADDVLTKSTDGTYMKHTGLGCFGIVLADEQVVPIGKPVKLRFI